MLASHDLGGGFADPVFDSQAVFRAVLDAMARPGAVLPMPRRATPPTPLNTSAAAILLALADADTPVFLDGGFADTSSIAGWIRFHAGAPVVDAPEQASFAVIGDPHELRSFDGFGQGSAEYPDRSATLVLQVPGLSSGEVLTLRGPGVRDAATLAVPGLPDSFAEMWSRNRAAFPLGVDLIFAAPDAVAALPRTTEIVVGADAAGRT